MYLRNEIQKHFSISSMVAQSSLLTFGVKKILKGLLFESGGIRKIGIHATRCDRNCLLRVRDFLSLHFIWY